jgi:hypothetical protein
LAEVLAVVEVLAVEVREAVGNRRSADKHKSEPNASRHVLNSLSDWSLSAFIYGSRSSAQFASIRAH